MDHQRQECIPRRRIPRLGNHRILGKQKSCMDAWTPGTIAAISVSTTIMLIGLITLIIYNCIFIVQTIRTRLVQQRIERQSQV